MSRGDKIGGFGENVGILRASCDALQILIFFHFFNGYIGI